MIESQNVLLCPRAQKGLAPIPIEIAEIRAIEDRVKEVAFVTPTKAPELLARFNEGYLFLHRQISVLEYEHVQAEREANKVRAVVLLDRVPGVLKEKGLTSSVDLRNAVLDQDEEYQDACDRANQIRCVVELLKGKMKGLEMAYSSVKKIMNDSAFNMLNRPMSTGGVDAGEIGTAPAGFGKAKF